MPTTPDPTAPRPAGSTASQAPRGRRERPAKPALTREGIIATAVAVMRSEGLERVTMRRLARELDTGPASLYVYVAHTAELHAAVLDELLGEVDLRPARTKGDWRERLVRVLSSYTEVLFAHPELARSALVTRLSGPHYLQLVETVLTLLAEGGVTDDRAAWGVDALLLLGTATAAEQSTRDAAPHSQDEHNALMTAVHGASAQAFPRLNALGPELFTGTGEARLTWGFHVLINGMLATARSDRPQTT
ncbi:TetR/AcrR family transcriptional regulator [Streptomyces sp. WZ-12]|uniref:TetR/AcrR family transcriptional regulator n=1 Tax=Streptomyces sp. WZ-12 TaxID=3030210 RepID=UPI002380F111|nr:TetR/AcrR family transcriptional regulator [Streptomyces sp. WZ-12]